MSPWTQASGEVSLLVPRFDLVFTVGGLLYFRTTRLDIAYPVGVMSRFVLDSAMLNTGAGAYR